LGLKNGNIRVNLPPDVIGNFKFHCEGQTDLGGTPAWQLTFEESPDPRKSFHQIRISNSIYQLRFKGRAWIAADDHQILRLETDLVAPLPEIRLQLEHLDISYAPVKFGQTEFRVWLPASASIQIQYRGRSYERIHKFSQFDCFLSIPSKRSEAKRRARDIVIRTMPCMIKACSLSPMASAKTKARDQPAPLTPNC
jgi:hypothetical protein